MIRKTLLAGLLLLAPNALADIYDRIDDCEAAGGGACLFDLMRELAGRSGDGGVRGVCASVEGNLVIFQITAPRDANVQCYYNNTAFPEPPSFNRATGRWCCPPWSRGNPGYEINVQIDGVSHITDENTALANRCPDR